IRRGLDGIGGKFLLGRQLSPAELILKRIGLGCYNTQPIFDGTCRTGRYASHAAVAYVDVHDIVIGIVGDGIDAAGLFARMATNADLWSGRVLFDNALLGFYSHARSPYRQSRHCRQARPLEGPPGPAHTAPDPVDTLYQQGKASLIKAHILEVDRLAVDAHHRRCDPVGKL